MAAFPLASFAAETTLGLIANHIPLLAGPAEVLIGHIALANDMHRLIADGHQVLAILHGEDAYISPNYYPSKAAHLRRVLTWNYQAVHAHGTQSFQHDEHSQDAAVDLLTRVQERRVNGANTWRMADAPADYMEQMPAQIVDFRIEVTRTFAKSKLSQNREARDYRDAVAGLRATGEVAMADLMARRRPEEP